MNSQAQESAMATTTRTAHYRCFLLCLSCLFWGFHSHAAIGDEPPTAEHSSPQITSNVVQYAGEQTLHYASAGDSAKPGLLFIHGTPGSWSAFKGYLEHPQLSANYFMVSVDRPGWGKSAVSKEQKKSSLGFDAQATAIAHVMTEYPDKKWVVIGHSLGASIAPKVGLVAPDRVVGLLLLAGSLQPKLGKPRWYNRFANNRLLKWMLPSHLNYSNDEIMVLRRELTAMENQLLAKQAPIDLVIIQGMKDKLVSPKNAGYVEAHWADAYASVRTIELPDAGHFIPWEQFSLVVETIFEFN